MDISLLSYIDWTPLLFLVLFPAVIVLAAYLYILYKARNGENPWIKDVISNSDAVLKIVQLGPQRSSYKIISKDGRTVATVSVNPKGGAGSKTTTMDYGDTHWRFTRQGDTFFIPKGSPQFLVYKNDAMWGEIKPSSVLSLNNANIFVERTEKYFFSINSGVIQFKSSHDQKITLEVDKEGNVLLPNSHEIGTDTIFLSAAAIYMLWNMAYNRGGAASIADLVGGWVYKQ